MYKFIQIAAYLDPETHSYLSNEERDHVEKEIYKTFKSSNQANSQAQSQSQANQQESQSFTQINKEKKKTLFDAFANECNMSKTNNNNTRALKTC